MLGGNSILLRHWNRLIRAVNDPSLKVFKTGLDPGQHNIQTMGTLPMMELFVQYYILGLFQVKSFNDSMLLFSVLPKEPVSCH